MIEFKANQYKRLAGCHSHKSHENSLSNLKIFFNEILRQKYEMAIEYVDFIKVSKALRCILQESGDDNKCKLE